MATYRLDDNKFNVTPTPLHDGLGLIIASATESATHPVSLTPLADGNARLHLGSTMHIVAVAEDGDDLLVQLDGEVIRLHRFTAFEAAGGRDAGKDSVIAPMPGTVISVTTQPGDQVTKNDPLMVIESMKLQTTIGAPRDGTIDAVCFAANDTFDKGAALITLMPLPTDDEETA